MFVDSHLARMGNPDSNDQIAHMCSYSCWPESIEATRIDKLSSLVALE